MIAKNEVGVYVRSGPISRHLLQNYASSVACLKYNNLNAAFIQAERLVFYK